MNANEKKMLALLVEGREKYGIDAVKAEFEAEGTRHDELLRLLEIARRAGVKVGLKIGGCEAIRDLLEARQFGVDYVIAPMVETPYALKKYAAARSTTFPDGERGDTQFLFNVETISTYEQLDAMAALAGRERLGLVFGRVDFAGSLDKDRSFVNGTEMEEYLQVAARHAVEQDVPLVVGGGVNHEAIGLLRRVRRTRLDRFETRKVIFDATVLDQGNAIEDGLSLAIEFELTWLRNKRDYYRQIAAEDETRIAMIEERQAARA